MLISRPLVVFIFTGLILTSVLAQASSSTGRTMAKQLCIEGADHMWLDQDSTSNMYKHSNDDGLYGTQYDDGYVFQFGSGQSGHTDYCVRFKNLAEGSEAVAGCKQRKMNSKKGTPQPGATLWKPSGGWTDPDFFVTNNYCNNAPQYYKSKQKGPSDPTKGGKKPGKPKPGKKPSY